MAWLANYTKRIKITTDFSKVDATLANFPITVFFTAAQAEEIFSEFDADSDYMKCAFTTDDGETQLYAEKELFDHSESKAIYHVKVTSISSSAGTDIYYYYNNSGSDNTTYIGIADYKVYPTAHSDTYVKSTTKYGETYWAYFATDPAKSLTGAGTNNAWASDSVAATNQRFHIDLGSAKTIKSIYYENYHSSGGSTGVGVQNFTFWGSNTGAGSFDDLVYANDGGWTELTVDNANKFDQHTGSDVADPKYITVTNTVAYRYYAFKFADNYGSAFMGVRRIVLGIGSNPHNVWDSNFKAVHHMADRTASTSFVDDSTSNNNDGTKKAAGQPAQITTGKVGYCQDGDETDDYISIGTLGNFGSELGTNKPTIEYIYKSTNTAARSIGLYDGDVISIYIKLNYDSDNANQTGYIRAFIEDSEDAGNPSVSGAVNSNTGISDGNFHHLAVKFDGPGNNIDVFVDGTEETFVYKTQTTPSTFLNLVDNFNIMGINVNGVAAHFNNIVDEVRISNTLRTAAWIKATYNTLWDTFLTYGSEETSGAEEDNAIFFGVNF